MRRYAWEVIGTQCAVSIGGDVREDEAALIAECTHLTHAFDALYSRYKEDSLVSRMAQEKGIYDVPRALTVMLRHYEVLYRLTGGLVTPTIGRTLEDVGLDARYSLSEKPMVTVSPPLERVLTIVSDTQIILHEPVLLDLGALGKGFLVDEVYTFLQEKGCTQFLVDGSGDIRYYSKTQEPIVCGLEHPLDTTLAIGTLSLTHGALCASATNRRAWGKRHHYVNPFTNESPHDIVATWVYADTAVLADGISSALFFVDPERLAPLSFDYLVVNNALQMKRSAGFTAELFH